MSHNQFNFSLRGAKGWGVEENGIKMKFVNVVLGPYAYLFIYN